MRCILALIFIHHHLIALAQIPAFPRAEGWGRYAIGGRGGIVIEVTNLNDSGPGSFRAACEATSPRTIIFKIGGIIELQSEIQLTNPFIYIAGQTAPGGGIVLKNFGLAIFTHDIIIRGLRIRIGDDLHFLSPDNRDCVAIQSGAENVIIDHCSFSWGGDENVSLWGPNVQKITLQWNIISEALHRGIHPKGAHSMGLLTANNATKTSFHHNILAHNGARNPMIAKNIDHEFVNNLVYDWLYKSDLQEQGTQFKLDYRGNYLKPLSNSTFPELPIGLDFDASSPNNSKLHMVNNYCSPGNPFITPAQLAAFGANAAIFSQNSLLTETSTVSESSAFEAYTQNLSYSGALHPQRDATDNRIIQNIQDSTGGMLDCIKSTPIVLDSGFVVGATDSTIIYTMLGKPIIYSAESRKISIISGPGAGQTRYGAMGSPAVIDLNNLIFESKIIGTWATLPTSGSYYKFFAGCNNTLGGFPAYSSGSGYLDTDHDGMPDDWELANGLNPNLPSDRNDFGLSTEGYTNLEVYLNGYYTGNPSLIQGFKIEERFKLSPNPATEYVSVETDFSLNDFKISIYNASGVLVFQQVHNSGGKTILPLINLQSGVYSVQLSSAHFLPTEKLVIIK